MATVQLRPATLADATLVADLHATSRRATYRGVLTDHYLDHEVQAESLAAWHDKLADFAAGAGQVLVAEREGTPIAFISVFAPDGDGSVYVDALHALPQHKGSGAGSALLDEAQRWACSLGARGMHLKVVESNRAAIGFYEARGWRQTGSLVDHLGGIDVVALEYALAF